MYRIVKCIKGGDTFFRAQKKRHWLLGGGWIALCRYAGDFGDIDRFNTYEEAKALIVKPTEYQEVWTDTSGDIIRND